MTAADADGDTLTFGLSNPPAGMTIDANGLLSWTPQTDQLGPHAVTVTVVDPTGVGAAQDFTLTVLAHNDPPHVLGQPQINGTVGRDYRHAIEAADPDGDELTFQLVTGPEGMTVDPQGLVAWTPSDEQIGDNSVVVRIRDDRGAAILVDWEINVQEDTAPPLVGVELSDNPVELGSTFTVTVAAVDNVAVDSIRLTLDGQPVILDDAGVARIQADRAGVFPVVATARDINGNESQATLQLQILDPSDVEAPEVEIVLPNQGKPITAATDIVGTVTDTNLSEWTLEIVPLEGGDGTVIATGTTPVVNGVLGTLDPSALANDSYVLRLTAEDLGGNISSLEVNISIAGELKIGNFTLSFTDLTVPVSGIPVVMSRTYDSLSSQEEGDFGFGWSVELRDTDLRASVPVTPPELREIGVYNPYYFGTRVFVTVPGEGRQGFEFKPRLTRLSQQLIGLFGPRPSLMMYEPVFESDAGIYSTLRPADDDLVLLADDEGNFFEMGTGLPYNPADPIMGGEFMLETKEGATFEIDGETGDAEKITDRNQNTLSFTNSGVFSSSGQSILFERDPRGRVIAVIDPEGNRIQYDYDARGNLASVTDRAGNVTRYRYEEPTNPHYLTEVVDPLGRAGVRSEYDDQGRLVRVVDAADQNVRIVHDPDHFIESIVDQLGNETVYEYDGLGNVVNEVDPQGGVTRRTYDDIKNPTLETSTSVVLADGSELITRFEYDNRGNVLRETDPMGRVTHFTYDSFGNVLTTTDPSGNTTANRYDTFGNLLSTTDADGVVTSFAYDASGNPTRIDSGGNVTQFTNDGTGNVIRQQDAAGMVRTFTYDGNGNQLTESVVFTTPSGPSTVTTANTYDDEGRVTLTVVTQDGVELTRNGSRYDAVGNRIEQVDALGRVTRFEYDDRGQLVKTIFPDGDTDPANNPFTRSEYDAAGNTIAERDEAGRVTRFVYDRGGRRVETILPDDTPADDSDNPRTRTVYDLADRVVAEIDEFGHRTEFRHDAAGNVIETILPDDTPADLADNPRIADRYDVVGRRIATIDPLGHVTKFVYSSTGLLLATILPDATPADDSDNPRQSSTFDPQTRRLVGRTDPEGHTTSYGYDDLGRLTSVTQTVAGADLHTEYEYDALGNLVVQRDANGHETHYEYDGLGRRSATVLPLGQRSTTRYNSVGNVIATTDFNGATITYDYDALNRLVSKHFPDATSTQFTYTVTGQQSTVTDARGNTSFAYDARDRLLARTDPDGTSISYAYDRAGNITTVSTQVGTVTRQTTYSYDTIGRMKTAVDPEGGETEYFYDTAGRLVRTELPNGTVELREYNERNQLLLVEHRNKATNEVFSSFRYTLDKTGNRTAVAEQDGRRVEYDYDEIYRLIGEDIFDAGSAVVSRSIDYAYDLVGNRLTRNDTSEGPTTYTYDDNDRLLTESFAGEVTRYEYDNNGNTLRKVADATDQVLTEYTWDFDNRLISADTDGDGEDDVSYCYDSDGMRVSQTVGSDETRFLLDKNRTYAEVLEEYTPGGIIKVSYVHGLDLISQNRHGETGTSWYHVDGLGSTRALTDSNGAATDRYNYDAFGRLIGQVGSTGNLYLFAGEQRDQILGIDYLRARYFLPKVGRFLSRDPYFSIVHDPITIHRYLYAGANPANKLDPSGLFSLNDVGTTLAVVGVLSSLAVPQLLFATAFRAVSREVVWDAELKFGTLTVGVPTFSVLSLKATSRTNPKAEGEWLLGGIGLGLGIKATGGSTKGTLTAPAPLIKSSNVFSGTFFLVSHLSYGIGVSSTNSTTSSNTFAQIGFGFGDFSGSFIGFDLTVISYVAGFSRPSYFRYPAR